MRAYVVVEPRIVGDADNWELVCQSDRRAYPSFDTALKKGEERLEHDDFWVIELEDDFLRTIRHSDGTTRKTATDAEFAAVAETLRRPASTSARTDRPFYI